jgi:hypothetical protein
LRINGPNIFSATNQQQILNELNLKDGQKVIGKIITLANDEALLEIAGRPIQAKIEGNPPLTGSTQTFLVNTDEQGRIILKVQQNPQDTSNETTVGNANSPKTNVTTEDTYMQKSILSALTKDGLAPNNENVEKVTRYLQDFQEKYQQPLGPNVFTFIMAQKWPVTPATVLASWVHQDSEVRDILWDKLQETLPEQQDAGPQTKLALNMQSEAPEISDKLKSLVDLKIQDLFDKLSDLLQASKNKQQPANISTKNALPNPAKSDLAAAVTKNQTAIGAKVLVEEKAIEPLQEKIQSILDQNIGINKAILKETAVNGSSNLIPLLVNDSHATIRECLVQWKEEKSNNNGATNDQVVHMTIPTENMGDISLALRIGSGSTRINLRVNSEEVRKYFMQHTAELKTDIAKDNALISVNLNENEDLTPGLHGVDIWM